MAKSPLIKKLIKNSKIESTSTLEESTVFNNITTTRTKIPIINLALSGEFDGGLTSGFTAIAGPSKHFKSLLGLLCVGAYMDENPDAVCLFYDSEKGTTKAYLRSMGIDPERVVYSRITTVEMLRNDIVTQLDGLERGEKVIVFVDSIGNTASKKEMADALADNDKQDMTRAKALKGMFRMLTPYLADLDIPMVAICHTYDTQEMYSKKVVSGGTGIMYSADTVLIIGKQQEKEGTELTGFKFILNIEKSRFVKEKEKLPLEVSFKGGISAFSGLLELATIVGYVGTPTKGWRSRKFLDEETGELVFEEKKWRESDTDCVAFWKPLFKHEPFMEAVRAKYKISELNMTDNSVLDDLYSDQDIDTIPDEIEDDIKMPDGDTDIDQLLD
ncbi:RecA-like recombination protein [Pectobacterium phage POP12]|nr:RecA-like recombination protein [Pectobacterium phage POP12]